MPRLSILNLEQRVNPTKELNKLYHHLLDQPYITINYESFSFIKYMNRIILALPFCGSSDSFNNYWADRNIILSSESDNESTTTLLYLISFYSTFNEYIKTSPETQELLNKSSLMKIQNIISTSLKHLNYQIIYEEEKNEYGFKTPLVIKRDTDVDSVLSLIENRDIHIDLLSYLDFRLENNLQVKQSILARLYKTVIDDEKDTYFNSTQTDNFRLKYQYELYERIKQLYNQTDIRHGEKGKVELSEPEKLKYCDMCFYLLLQLIRTPKSIEDMKDIKSTFGQKNR